MKFLLITFTVLAFYTCNTTQTTTTTETKDKVEAVKAIHFAKGGCHGTCPIYGLTLYTDGKAVYEGIRFSDRLGEHHKMLPKTTIDALLKECEAANLFGFPDRYESRIPDLASSTLTYMKGTKTKTIFWREQADDGVKNIGKQIEAIAKDAEGWAMSETQALPAGAIPSELILNLDKEVDPKRFIAAYSAYGMKVKERLNPRGNYWLMAYDTSKIKPFEMLNKITKDKRVLMAEFNKHVTQRGN